MNRFLFRYVFCLSILLAVVYSCVDPIHNLENGGENNLLPVSFRVCTQDDVVLTKGGPISGTDGIVTKLFLYCFDQNGRYLGRFQATDLSSSFEAAITNQEEPDDNTQPAGDFKALIPPKTARIHFVGNADKPVGNDYIGMTEVQVMHDSNIVCSKVNDIVNDEDPEPPSDPMAYWGYLKEDNPDDLADLLDPTSNSTTTIWMVRDRLWIEAGGHGEDISDVKWVVYNGLKKGYLAPCHFSVLNGTTIDPVNPYQPVSYVNGVLETEVTPSVVNDRFVTEEGDMEPFDKDHPMYVFEDYCNPALPSQVTKIIVKAKFNSGNTKYFPICITQGYNEESIPLKRGRKYLLNLENLPEGSGLSSFTAAAEANFFVNGSLAYIPEDVIEVSDGRFDMKVNIKLTYPLSQESFFSTAVLLQSTPDENKVVVPFSVSPQTSFSAEFDFKESAWLSDVTPQTAAGASGDIVWGTEIGEDKKVEINSALSSTVTLPVKSVGSSLKESVFNLKGFYESPIVEGGDNVKHVLMRNISVYSIEHFQIQDGSIKLERIQNQTGQYRLKFRLPTGSGDSGDHDEYPELLYPLQIKLASKTLQPIAIGTAENTPEAVVFGVQVRSTVPGTQPAMLTQPTEDDAPEELDTSNWDSTAWENWKMKQWNYQSTDNYWNYWYVYPLVSAPANPEIWIDLRDVRNSGAFNIVPDNVGLFLYIEFFGPAQAVSYTPSTNP